jgi:hypothetical protein
VGVARVPATRLGLYSLMLSRLLCDTSLSSMTHLLTKSTTSSKAQYEGERIVKVKRPHGHDMRRIKFEAKEKDQGSTLLQTCGWPLYGAPIWPGITSRYIQSGAFSAGVLSSISSLKKQLFNPYLVHFDALLRQKVQKYVCYSSFLWSWTNGQLMVPKQDQGRGYASNQRIPLCSSVAMK